MRADRRDAGLGEQMIAWAVQEARGRGCRLVQLTSNRQRDEARRHPFYERLGFEPTHVGLKLQLLDD